MKHFSSNSIFSLYSYFFRDYVLKDIRQELIKPPKVEKTFQNLMYVHDKNTLPLILYISPHTPETKIAEINQRVKYYLGFDHLPIFTYFTDHRINQHTEILCAEKQLLDKVPANLLPNVHCIDYEDEAYEGVNWHVLLSRIYFPIRQHGIDAGHRILSQYLTRLQTKKYPRTYVFGTGPSLGKMYLNDYSDGYRIVCNSIVKDKATWQHIQPHLFVAADPVNHFGISSYAKQFRKDFIARFKEHPSVILVYPDLYHVFMIRAFPDFAERFCPIPTVNAYHSINTNLINNYWLKDPDNILTLLLLPLAATLTKEIRLVGFDGRQKKDKYFWDHSQKHNYNDLISTVKDTHPSYYKYFLTKNKIMHQNKHYGATLEKDLQAYERQGYSIRLLHESTIKPLQKRRLEVSTKNQN